MIRDMELFIIIIITVLTNTQGHLQSCFHYCNNSSELSSKPDPECNCILNRIRGITGINRIIPSNIGAVTPSPNLIKDTGIYYEPAKHDSSKDSIDYDKVLRSFTFNSDPHQRSPLLLYLDVELNKSAKTNKSQVEQLKNMFATFQTAEKDLGDCLNLHIYIFSKYINTKNLTQKTPNVQELTEIEHKCNHTDSIIKQNIFQIEQSYPGMEHPNYPHPYQDIKFQNIPTNVNLTEKEVTTDNVISANNLTKSNKPSIGEVPSDTNNFSSKLSTFAGEQVSETVEHAKSEVNMDITTVAYLNRKEFDKDDLEIPKISTKETNGTVISNVVGNEEISYSDFDTNTIISSYESTALFENTTTEPESTTLENVNQSNFVKIHGNLYFLFGNKHIPARFIQQANGNLDIAIDGFSLCVQMLEENTTSFINTLCHCIQLQDCTYLQR